MYPFPSARNHNMDSNFELRLKIRAGTGKKNFRSFEGHERITTHELLQKQRCKTMHGAQPFAAVLELHRRVAFRLWKEILRLPLTVTVALEQARRKTRKIEEGIAPCFAFWWAPFNSERTSS